MRYLLETKLNINISFNNKIYSFIQTTIKLLYFIDLIT